MLDLDERLDELRELGRYRRLRMVSGPQGPRVVLDGRPVLLLCSGTRSAWPTTRASARRRPTRRCAGASAPAARVASGTMTLHRRLEERLAAFSGTRAGLLFGSGSLANLGVIPALAAPRRGRLPRRAQPRLDRRRLQARRRGGVRLRPRRRRAPRVGAAPGRRPRRADRHRGPVRPRRRRRAARGDRRARAPLRRARARRRVARDRPLGPGRPRRGRRGRAGGRGRRDHRLARARARRLRRLRDLRPRDGALPRQQRAHVAALDGAVADRDRGGDGGAGPARGAAAADREAAG